MYKLMDIQHADQKEWQNEQSNEDLKGDVKDQSSGSQYIKSTGDGTNISEKDEGLMDTMSNDSYEELQLGDLKETVINKLRHQNNMGYNFSKQLQGTQTNMVQLNNDEDLILNETLPLPHYQHQQFSKLIECELNDISPDPKITPKGQKQPSISLNNQSTQINIPSTQQSFKK